jgi:SPOR domain
MSVRTDNGHNVNLLFLTYAVFVGAWRRRSRFGYTTLATIAAVLEQSVKKSMGETIDTPVTGDISHLSIEDLLAPLPETQRLGGAGPFVINLIASSAPIGIPSKGIAGCERARIFQVQRMEDRRPRYRLRLGPFITEEEAEAVLANVRAIYPSALTATADAEDLRALAAIQTKQDALQPQTERPRQTVTVTPAAAQIVPSLSLLAVPAEPAPPPKVQAQVPKVQVQAPKVQVQAPKAPAPAPKAQAPPPVPHLSKPLPNLDATQTVRALTSLELEDDQASRWFVIQLALADDAFDPDVLPNLDIFYAYRLYSVAGIDQGRIVHALRMGFFSEEVGARAVASYLAAYYSNPTIKRVSSAERQRFADQRLEPRKDVGASGKQAMIEITNERFVRERRSTTTVSQKGR